MIVELLGLEDQRDHQFPVPTIRSAGRQHAHHRINPAVDLHRLAKHFGVCTEMPPQPMGKNHDVFFTWLAFLRQEIAAKEQGVSEHCVVAWGGFHTFEIFRPIPGGDIEIVRMAVSNCSKTVVSVSSRRNRLRRRSSDGLESWTRRSPTGLDEDTATARSASRSPR